MVVTDANTPPSRGRAAVRRQGVKIFPPSKLALIFFLTFAQSEKSPALPDGPGKDTFASVCSLCHDPSAPMGKQWTRQEWELKVIEMLQEEPDVTREERAAIVEYLTANFRPGGKIYINKAAAKDLESALEISAAEAEAILRYRRAQGDFKSFEDLRKVPSVDTAKLEAKKERLVF